MILAGQLRPSERPLRRRRRRCASTAVEGVRLEAEAVGDGAPAAPAFRVDVLTRSAHDARALGVASSTRFIKERLHSSISAVDANERGRRLRLGATTLELETLDFHELRASMESMELAAMSHMEQIRSLAGVTREGSAAGVEG